MRVHNRSRLILGVGFMILVLTLLALVPMSAASPYTLTRTAQAGLENSALENVDNSTNPILPASPPNLPLAVGMSASGALIMGGIYFLMLRRVKPVIPLERLSPVRFTPVFRGHTADLKPVPISTRSVMLAQAVEPMPPTTQLELLRKM